MVQWGPMLHARGVGFDKCFDELNLTNPAVVAEIHREYIEAGAQLVITNTFGANRFKLSKHGLEDDVKEINHKGVELAKRVVAASFKDVSRRGRCRSAGGEDRSLWSSLSLEEAREAFAEQIQALADAGADLVVIETMSDMYEIREAIKAARGQRLLHLPVVASVTFTRDDRHPAWGPSRQGGARAQRSRRGRDRRQLFRRTRRSCCEFCRCKLFVRTV